MKRKNIKKLLIIFMLCLFILTYFSNYDVRASSVKAQTIALNTQSAVSVTLDEIINREFFIKNAYSGRYLDVSGGVASNGTNVQQYEFNGTDSQRWAIKLKEGSNSEIFIASRLGNDGTSYKYCLDVDGGSSSNGANMQIYGYNGTAAQLFKVKHWDSHFVFELRTGSSGYNTCVGLSGLDLNNGGNVEQREFAEDFTCVWILEPVVKYDNWGAKYALANYDDHLTAYPNCEGYGGDCTNFASQCVNARGLHYSGDWYMYKINNLNPQPSNTFTFRISWGTGDPAAWVNAQDFRNYWLNDSRTSVGKSFVANDIIDNMGWIKEKSEVKLGDIIQVAYNDNGGTRRKSSFYGGNIDN